MSTRRWPARRALPDWEDARFLERFWFDADAQRAPIGLLSGGERRRLQLVLTLRQRPNVLLLDEPTNDLDLDTLRVLEDVLEEWPGAVVVVSHDRAFLERTVTDVLAIDAERPGRRVPGGFAAWEAQRSIVAPPARHWTGAGEAHRAGTVRNRRPDGHRRRCAGCCATPRRRSQSHERRRDKLMVELAAAGNDHLLLTRLGHELAAAESALAATEERWLELSTELDAR